MMVTLEGLLELIARATNERNGHRSDASADSEYAMDMLNEFLPGLGDVVVELPRDYNVAWPSDNRELMPGVFEEHQAVWVPGVAFRRVDNDTVIVLLSPSDVLPSSAPFKSQEIQMR